MTLFRLILFQAVEYFYYIFDNFILEFFAHYDGTSLVVQGQLVSFFHKDGLKKS